MQNKSFITFLTVGAVSAVCNWTSRFAFQTVMSFGDAVASAYLVGMAIAYIGNRLFVFEPSNRKAWDEIARFSIVNLVSLGQVWIVSIGLVRYGFPRIGFNWQTESVAHAAGLASIAGTSYLAHRHFTFSKNRFVVSDEEKRKLPDVTATSQALPLAVDMDGTLLRTDVLIEGLVAGLFHSPLQVLGALPLLGRSRVAFKAAVAEITTLHISDLPVRQSMLDHLIKEKGRGRSLYLVTAGFEGVAQSVAKHFDIFSGVYGSDGLTNLKGRQKLTLLRELFPDGFAYAGDSYADLPVWEGAESIILAGASRNVARRALGIGKPLEAVLDIRRFNLQKWRKALRLHQWSKNLLIFVPLFLGKEVGNIHALIACIFGFLLMGLAASATYLINDLADLDADRRHRTKRYRPIASGDVSLMQAMIAAPLMVVAALAGSIAISSSFALSLFAYLAITLSYSLRFKRVVLLDVMILGSLYTIRLISGTLLSDVVFSPWLLTFSFFFFFSMSLAKRHVEVAHSDAPPEENLPGRGYRPSDAPLTLSMGIATSAAAVLVIVQYMMAEAFPSGIYRFSGALWATPILLGLWICRVWLLAHRGQLADDPVAFAIKDRLSIFLGFLLGVAFIVARLF